MPIPTKLTKEQYDALPDMMKDGYKETPTGEFEIVAVQGMVPKTQLDEFRTNNRGLQEQVKEISDKLAVFDGLDPEEYAALKEKERQIKEKELIDAGDIDQIVAERVKPIVGPLNDKIKGLEEKAAVSNAELARLKIDEVVTNLTSSAGIADGSLSDFHRRAREVFRIEDGKVIAKDGEGNTLYGADGVTPMALDGGWVEGLKKSASYLFRPAQGTGAAEGNGVRRPGAPDRGDMNAVQMINAGLEERSGAA